MNSYNATSFIPAPGTKVLLANMPFDGHFNPLTSIAARLKTLGCDVRWYTSPKYQRKVEALGIPFFPTQKVIDLGASDDPNEIFPERLQHKSQTAKLKFDIVELFVKTGPQYYEDLLDIHREFAFEVMVCDVAFSGISFVKELMKIPVVSIGIFPLTQTSRDLPPAGLGLTPDYSWLGKVKQGFLRWFADTMIFGDSKKEIARIFREYGIKNENCNVFDVNIIKSDIYLQSGTPSFEYRRSDMLPQIRFAGALLPVKKNSDRKPWHHPKLHRYQQVVLCTQGTVEKDVNKLLVPTLEALKDTDVLLIVATGGSGTEALRKTYDHDNVIIEDFIPFDEVMPYADLYISNGGYGGVMLGIQHELPMVVAGVHEGKNEINARIGYFKLGVNLKTETPKPEQISKAVKEVMNKTVYKESVKALAKEFASFQTNDICMKAIADLLPAPSRVLKIDEEVLVY